MRYVAYGLCSLLLATALLACSSQSESGSVTAGTSDLSRAGEAESGQEDPPAEEVQSGQEDSSAEEVQSGQEDAPVEGGESEMGEEVAVTGTAVREDDYSDEADPVEAGTVHLLPPGSAASDDAVASFEVKNGEFAGLAPMGEWSICHTETNGFFACVAGLTYVFEGNQATVNIVLGDGSMGAEIV